MFVAHAPVGYITHRLLFPRAEKLGVTRRTFLFWAVFGAVAPDLDLFYFFLIDHRQHPHHAYASHWPLCWVLLLLLAALWFGRDRRRGALALVFSLGGLLHMVLDTVAGDIRWLAPFSDRAYALFHVQAVLQPWWLSFFVHPSFLLELLLVALALVLWWRARSERGQE